MWSIHHNIFLWESLNKWETRGTSSRLLLTAGVTKPDSRNQVTQTSEEKPKIMMLQCIRRDENNSGTVPFLWDPCWQSSSFWTRPAWRECWFPPWETRSSRRGGGEQEEYLKKKKMMTQIVTLRFKLWCSSHYTFLISCKVSIPILFFVLRGFT